MPKMGYRKPQGQRPMRSLFVLDDERALVKRVAKLVKHGTDSQRAQLVAFADIDTCRDDMRFSAVEYRRAYTIRAYDGEWEIIKAFMDAAKQDGMHQPARALLTRLENEILIGGIQGAIQG